MWSKGSANCIQVARNVQELPSSLKCSALHEMPWAVASMGDASERCNSKQPMAKAPMVEMIVYSPDRCRCVRTLQVKYKH